MPRIQHRLLTKYYQEVVPRLMSELGYKNIMQVPKVEKVVLNVGVGEGVSEAKAIEAAKKDLIAISGQQPVVTRAKRAISSFKLRRGMPIGVMVTLRGVRMYDFLDKLFNIVLPRIRDFRGVSRNSWDGRGNYSLGIKEQIVFPEISYEQIYKIKGLQVNIVTTARTNKEGERLLELWGLPFERG